MPSFYYTPLPKILDGVEAYLQQNNLPNNGERVITGGIDALTQWAVEQGIVSDGEKASFSSRLGENSVLYTGNDLSAGFSHYMQGGHLFVSQIPAAGMDMTTKIPYELRR